MERSPLAGYKSLRLGRALEANMVLSVEPGIYFNDYNLDLALANPEQVGALHCPSSRFQVTVHQVTHTDSKPRVFLTPLLCGANAVGIEKYVGCNLCTRCTKV